MIFILPSLALRLTTDLYLDLSKRFEEINSFENILLSSNPIKVLDNTFELMGEIFYEYRFLLSSFSNVSVINFFNHLLIFNISIFIFFFKKNGNI